MFRTDPRTNWTLIVKVRDDEVYASMSDIMRTMLIGSGVSVVLFCLVILLVVRGVTRRLGRTVHFAETVARGNLDEQLTLQSRDELAAAGRRSAAHGWQSANHDRHQRRPGS